MVFRDAKVNEAAARVVMRELAGGQLIRSNVAFNFGDGPEKVYLELKDRINAQGEPYGEAEEDGESAEKPAASDHTPVHRPESAQISRIRRA